MIIRLPKVAQSESEIHMLKQPSFVGNKTCSVTTARWVLEGQLLDLQNFHLQSQGTTQILVNKEEEDIAGSDITSWKSDNVFWSHYKDSNDDPALFAIRVGSQFSVLLLSKCKLCVLFSGCHIASWFSCSWGDESFCIARAGHWNVVVGSASLGRQHVSRSLHGRPAGRGDGEESDTLLHRKPCGSPFTRAWRQPATITSTAAGREMGHARYIRTCPSFHCSYWVSS